MPTQLLSHVWLFGVSMDCSLPESSVHGIFQANILEWICHFLLQGIFPTQGSNLCLISPALAGRFFITSVTWEALSLSWISAQGKSQLSWGSQWSSMDHLMTARPAPFFRSASLTAHLGEFTWPHFTYPFLVYSTSQWNKPQISHLGKASFQTQRSLCSVISRLWIKIFFFKGNWHQ